MPQPGSPQYQAVMGGAPAGPGPMGPGGPGGPGAGAPDALAEHLGAANAELQAVLEGQAQLTPEDENQLKVFMTLIQTLAQQAQSAGGPPSAPGGPPPGGAPTGPMMG